MLNQSESNAVLPAPMADDRLAKLIIDATINVFTAMLDMPLAIAETERRRHSLSAHFNGVIAVVGLAGAWIGTGGICCGEAVACNIAAQLLMAEFPAVDGEVIDAMGEVANIIVGNVKNELEGSTGTLQLSLPTVIHGNNLNTSSGRDQEWTIVSFSGPVGSFSVHLSLQQNAPAP